MLHQTKVQQQSTSEYSKNTNGYSTTPRHDFQNPKYSSGKVAFKIQKACINCGQGYTSKNILSSLVLGWKR